MVQVDQNLLVLSTEWVHPNTVDPTRHCLLIRCLQHVIVSILYCEPSHPPSLRPIVATSILHHDLQHDLQHYEAVEPRWCGDEAANEEEAGGRQWG